MTDQSTPTKCDNFNPERLAKGSQYFICLSCERTAKGLNNLEEKHKVAHSPIFSGDRLRLIGIGSLDGEPYYTRREVFDSPSEDYSGLFVYMCNNFLDKEPLPWEADTLKYRVESVDL